jgi:hypothetical protein
VHHGARQGGGRGQHDERGAKAGDVDEAGWQPNVEVGERRLARHDQLSSQDDKYVRLLAVAWQWPSSSITSKCARVVDIAAAGQRHAHALEGRLEVDPGIDELGRRA